MSNKPFTHISTEECLIFYKKILNNSSQKWSNAEVLANAGDHGSAISMAIISIEELIKSIVIFLDSMGFEFRKVNGINKLFKDHQIRYFIAYAIFAIGTFGDDLVKFIRYFGDNPDKISKFTDDIKNNKPFLEKTLKYYAYRKIITLRNELEWFSQVDIFRQNGFYCDYVDEVKTPLNITKEDYQKIYDRLKRVKEMGLGFFDIFENELYKEEFLHRISKFKNRKTYDFIEESLLAMKQSKTDPFNFMKGKFDSNVIAFIKEEKLFSRPALLNKYTKI